MCESSLEFLQENFSSSSQVKATHLLWFPVTDSEAGKIHNFQARVNLLPRVTNNGLTGVGVSPKIIHAQGSPKLQGKLEMFYGLD